MYAPWNDIIRVVIQKENVGSSLWVNWEQRKKGQQEQKVPAGVQVRGSEVDGTWVQLRGCCSPSPATLLISLGKEM